MRTKNFSNEGRWGVKTGVELNRWLLILQAYGVHSFKNVPNNFGDTGVSIFGNNAEYISISPEVAYRFADNFGITANVAGLVWGRLILAAPSFSVGVFWTP